MEDLLVLVASTLELKGVSVKVVQYRYNLHLPEAQMSCFSGFCFKKYKLLSVQTNTLNWVLKCLRIKIKLNTETVNWKINIKQMMLSFRL